MTRMWRWTDGCTTAPRQLAGLLGRLARPTPTARPPLSAACDSRLDADGYAPRARLAARRLGLGAPALGSALASTRRPLSALPSLQYCPNTAAGVGPRRCGSAAAALVGTLA